MAEADHLLAAKALLTEAERLQGQIEEVGPNGDRERDRDVAIDLARLHAQIAHVEAINDQNLLLGQIKQFLGRNR